MQLATMGLRQGIISASRMVVKDGSSFSKVTFLYKIYKIKI
ncbi:unnamed protein product [Nezara viridula]|uniref:Uncharacterized protein n=1 Tax=Nezara viridula TaxID=85310 RepID=A0A9P0HF83_NEZVI|nr:unnamed protein product [Nezara viridula]